MDQLRSNELPERSEEQLARFAEAVVGALAVPVAVIDGTFKVLAVSMGFTRLLADPTPPQGRQLLQLDNGRWDTPQLRCALEDVLAQKLAFNDIAVTDSNGRGWYLSGRVLPTGKHAELISLSFEWAELADRTATQLETREDHEGESLATEILATLREPMLVLDLEHRVKIANVAFYRLFRVSRENVIGRRLKELGNGQWDIPALHEQLETVLRKEHAFEDFEVEHVFQEIGQRTMLLNARRIDHLRLMLLAIEDVTERRRLARQQRIVNAELAHRLKNILAVIQSIANQTRAASVEDFRAALLGRIKALAVAHGVLIDAQWQDSDLRALIVQLLVPHTGDDGSDRVTVCGPSVALSPDQTTSFALIVHELATNATKYGALSIPSGHVAVSWSVQSGRLCFDWIESGGPRVASAPRSGFGTTLIKRTASYQFAGTAELNFEPTGLRCRLEFSLPL